MKSYLVCVATVGILGACLGPKAPSHQSWVERGDAALERDPGRALANYDRAADAAGSSKIRAAAIRWLRREVANRRATPTEPAADLSFVADARRHAAKRGVEEDLATELDAAEAAFAEAWWQDELGDVASRAPTALEQLTYLDAVRGALPASAGQTRQAADAEVSRRRIELFARYEQGRAEAHATPAAQAVYDALIGALSGKDADRAMRDRVAHAARASVTIARAGCDELRMIAAKVPTDGAHRVVIHVDGACTADESTRTYADVDHWTTYVAESYYETEYKSVCTSNYEAPTCVERSYKNGANGACVRTAGGGSTQTCHEVPRQVRRTRQKPISHQQTFQVRERTLTAAVAGTFVITVDGAERRVPFRVPLSVTEKQFTARESSSVFSRKTPRDVLADLVAGPLTEEVSTLAARVQTELLEAHLAAGRAKLATGDLRGAEAEVGAALFAGAPTLDAAFVPLAERAGMPLDMYAAVLRDGTLQNRGPMAPAGATLTVTLTVPEPDRDLAEAAIAKEASEADRKRAEVDAYYVDRHAGLLGIGIDRWTSPADESSHGLTVMWGARRGGGGMGGFWLYDRGVSFDLNAGLPGLGFDAHARLGGGYRHAWISAAGYAVGGVSRRGATGGMDPGLKLSLDAGYGVELVLGPTRERRLEILAERQLRPLVDEPEMGTAVLQRLRYELRYVRSDGSGEMSSGARGWCVFDQTSNEDALFVSAPTTTRACTIAVFLTY